MLRSLNTVHIIIRLGLAAVFFTFGVEKMLAPDSWALQWLPTMIQEGVRAISMAPRDLILLTALLEVLVGISLVTGYFIRIFAGIGLALIVVAAFIVGLSEQLILGVSVATGLAALVLWPEHHAWQ